MKNKTRCFSRNRCSQGRNVYNGLACLSPKLAGWSLWVCLPGICYGECEHWWKWRRWVRWLGKNEDWRVNCSKFWSLQPSYRLHRGCHWVRGYLRRTQSFISPGFFFFKVLCQFLLSEVSLLLFFQGEEGSVEGDKLACCKRTLFPISERNVQSQFSLSFTDRSM